MHNDLAVGMGQAKIRLRMTDPAVDHISNRCTLVVLVYQFSLPENLVNQEHQYKNSPKSF